jgi:uncharacterized protein YgiM (DUF1202 family)
MEGDIRQVIKGHIACYTDPVLLEEGDEVTVGHGDDEYPGWVWISTGDGKQGWAPREYLEITGDRARALRSYDSTELETLKGERLSVVLEHEGWALVENESGDRGWVPEMTLGNR